MYTLTLSREERAAFDWVGYRYDTGDGVGNILRACTPADCTEDDMWEADGEITFAVPEHAAWDIADKAEREDNLWPCFGTELARKMMAFVDAIV